MSDGEILRNYFMLRGAMLRQQQFPWQLSDVEQSKLARAVAREEKLVGRVLGLPLSSEIAVNDGELQRAVQTFVEGVAALGDIDDVLRQAGLNQQTLRAAIATEMAAAEVLQRIIAEVSPGDEEVYRWYQTHPDQFSLPERREVFQILITINDEYDDNRRATAQLRINEVAKLAHSAPDQFSVLALSHSECPSALENGRLGVVPPGHLYPELDRELFSLESGAVSKVVESPLGFHLLRCGTIEPGGLVAWEEVKEKLIHRLTQHNLKRYLEQHA